MYSNKLNDLYNVTPKRRRLGAGRIYVNSSNRNNVNNRSGNLTGSYSPDVFEFNGDSPPLPSNQVEYLHKTSYDNISSQSLAESSVFNDLNAENWESPVVIRNEVKNEIDDAESNDMFKSLEAQECKSQSTNELVVDFNNTNFKQSIADVLDQFDESMCVIDSKKETSAFFESKDSFLLDIKNTAELIENQDNRNVLCKDKNIKNNGCDSFYGLPLLAKKLFKMYRNIDKFYEWQDECLNLDAVRNHENLVYALPTSGGKTLVAEVLMLREVINNHRNALFVLPYVAIVQEKIWSLSPFAVQLDFLVEEYAAGKGHLPPKKRRNKNSIYIATIEKGLALVRSLIELNRLNELGLIVVDELHLIGEAGRGATLETLLSTVLFANQGIQIVGMSATIGNLSDITGYLNAKLYQRDFRPVDLTEYVKLGNMLYRIDWSNGLEIIPDRELFYEYSPAALSLDPELLGGLVSEVVPGGCCLLFCATRRTANNLAHMLATMQRREMLEHRSVERRSLAMALQQEGSSKGLLRAVVAGIGYHHAGLSTDERKLLEDAYKSGVISVLCCTSTLAVGVNLPAKRVLVRGPRVATQMMSLSQYRQMVGRAGRAGLASYGESILLCPENEWPAVREILSGGLSPVLSSLSSAKGALVAMLLSAIVLGLANTMEMLQQLLKVTLLYVQAQRLEVDIRKLCEEAVNDMIADSAIKCNIDKCTGNKVFTVSLLGEAATKACMELSEAKRVISELKLASRSLVLLDALHLLFLVTPNDVTALGIRPDSRHYYQLYTKLDDEGLQTAQVIGITEHNAIRMMTGKPITKVSESVLNRFYAALMLRDLLREMPLADVADKYMVPVGCVQSLISSCNALCVSMSRLTGALTSFSNFRVLLEELSPTLQYCAAPHLRTLMELPAVRKARALQLHRAGFQRIEDIAKSSPQSLMAAISNLSHTTATHIISSARMMMIEKVENLRAEAEEVMQELNA